MRFFYQFTRLSGWIVALPYFRKKVYYLNEAIQKRKIKGAMIIVCNHTDLLDFALLYYTFNSRYLRPIGGEVLFKKKANRIFFNAIGVIQANRYSNNYSFMGEAEKVLENNGVLVMFPEARLPRPGEVNGTTFTHGATYLALETGVKILPVYVKDVRNSKTNSKVVIGVPFDIRMLYDESISKEENVQSITEKIRESVYSLEEVINEEKK